MARTLKAKYLSLYISVMESDPKHEFEIYHKSFGFIESEWEWCERILHELKIYRDQNDNIYFHKSAGKLIAYLRYRLKNPAKKFDYPCVTYRLSLIEPQKDTDYITHKLPNYDVYLF